MTNSSPLRSKSMCIITRRKKIWTKIIGWSSYRRVSFLWRCRRHSPEILAWCHNFLGRVLRRRHFAKECRVGGTHVRSGTGFTCVLEHLLQEMKRHTHNFYLLLLYRHLTPSHARKSSAGTQGVRAYLRIYGTAEEKKTDVVKRSLNMDADCSHNKRR